MGYKTSKINLDKSEPLIRDNFLNSERKVRPTNLDSSELRQSSVIKSSDTPKQTLIELQKIKVIFSHLNLRDFQFPDKRNLIAKIYSVFYGPPKESTDLIIRQAPITSNFNLIKSFEGKIQSRDMQDVLYQNYNSIDRNDFSYTCKKDASIIGLWAVKSVKSDRAETSNSSSQFGQTKQIPGDDHPQESSMVFMMMNEKKPEEKTGHLKEMVSVHCIDVGRRKLKPLFLIPKDIFRDNDRLMAVRETDKVDGEFEFVLVVEKQKLLYIKNVSEEDWFKKLTDSHLTILVDKLANEVAKVALAFDLNRDGPSRFVLMSRFSHEYLFFFFVIEDKESTKSPPKIVLECTMTHPLEETKHLLESKIHSPSYQMVSFDSKLSIVVTGGLFISGDKYFIKLLFFNINNINNLPDDAGPKRHLGLRFDKEEDHLNYSLIVQHDILQKNENLPDPKFQFVEGSIEVHGKRFYIIVYGVTFTYEIFFAVARRSSNPNSITVKYYNVYDSDLYDGNRTVSTRDQLRSTTGASNVSTTNKHLSCIGSTMHLRVSQDNTIPKIMATVPIAFGDNSSHELAIDVPFDLA